MEISKHMELLGLKATDVVSGFSGVVTTVSFDLYGCVQAVITPTVGRDGKIGTGHWFDVTRLKITNKKPVMELPNFAKGYVAEGKKGCSIKPLP